MAEMMDRLLMAMNADDIDAFVACFVPEYRSETTRAPRSGLLGQRPGSGELDGRFAGVPDFHAELLASATTEDGVEIGEWHWQGTHADGSPFAMQGITVMGVEDGHLAWGRLYMEPIERDGAGIEQMVRESYRPPPAE